MFRMFFATISDILNVIRVNANTLANYSAVANVHSIELIEERLEGVQNIEAVQAKLRQLGLSTITELPKPQPKAKAKATAQA